MTQQKQNGKLIAIITMIFLFGMISFVTNLAAPMGIVLKNQFSVSNALGMLGNFGNFIAYAVMGIPSGILLQRVGYKKTALIAVAVGFIGVGIQYLSGHSSPDMAFAVYLIGAFIAGFSMCLLNTVVNPMLNKLGKVSDRKVPARAILVSAALILLSPIVNAIPGVSGAFVLFSSASSAVFLFIYILTLLAHRRYRRSADFIPDGFVMPAWKVLNTVAIVFFVFIYLTLFLADDTRNSAIAGLVWLVGFGGFSMLRERYRSRDLKAALEHKE